MNRIFAYLRRSVIPGNRLQRYLLYALGEILLLVAGILIALQVNTWNEERKNKDTRREMLIALQEEFQANLQQMDTVLSYNHRVMNGAMVLLALTPPEFDLQSQESLRELIYEINFNWTFNPSNGALRTGISSGNIHLIRNDNLLKHLFSWEDVVKDAAENEQRAVEYNIANRDMVGYTVRHADYRRLYFKEIGPSDFESDYRELLKNPEYEDFLTERYLLMKDATDELMLVRAQNVEILEEIGEELNNMSK